MQDGYAAEDVDASSRGGDSEERDALLLHAPLWEGLRLPGSSFLLHQSLAGAQTRKELLVLLVAPGGKTQEKDGVQMLTHSGEGGAAYAPPFICERNPSLLQHEYVFGVLHPRPPPALNEAAHGVGEVEAEHHVAEGDVQTLLRHIRAHQCVDLPKQAS